MKDEKKKQAFDKAVSDTVHCLYEFHRENMNKADDPSGYIQKQIDIFDSQLNRNNVLTSWVMLGHRDYSGFTEKICNEILSTEKPQKWDIVWREQEAGKWIAKENQFFGYTVDLKLKTKFQTLKVSLKTTKPRAYERVEEIKKERGVTYPEAIEIFNTEIGYQHFKNYESFKSSRYKAQRGY